MTAIAALSNRLYNPGLALILALLCAGATLAGVVALAKQPSFGAVALTLAFVMLIPVIAAAAKARSPSIGLALVIAVALGMRMASLGLIGTTPLTNDPMNYANLAHAMLRGDGMIVDDWRYGDGLRAYFPPLFPVILAMWWGLFGDSLWSTLWLNTAFAIGCAVALADCGRLLNKPVAGRAAALIFLVYPAFSITAGIPNKEMLAMLLAVLFVRTVLVWERRGADTNAWAIAASFGCLWGLMALTQAALALMPPVAAVLLIPRFGFVPLLMFGVRAMPFFVIVMSPWWVRNWLIFGDFVPFTTAAGFMINVMLGEAKLAIPPDIFALAEPDRSGRMAAMAIARIGEMPGAFIRSVLTAFSRGFGYEEAAIGVYRNMTPTIASDVRAALTPPLQLGYAAMLGGGAWSCWRAARSGARDTVIALALAMVGSIGLINMWFEFGERHRYHLTPLLILLAAVALTDGLKGGGAHRSKLSAMNRSSKRTP